MSNTWIVSERRFSLPPRNATVQEEVCLSATASLIEVTFIEADVSF
jgi:hypothetical protein